MIAIYIFIFLLASIPLLLTLKRIRKYRSMERNGIKAQARVVHIQIQPNYRSGPHDNLTLAFINLETNQPMIGHAATVHNKYKLDEVLDISYERGKTKIYVKGDEKGYRPALWFSIALLVFVVFAAYKINEMISTGNI